MRLEVKVYPEFGQPIVVEAEHLSVEVVRGGEVHRLHIFGQEYEAFVPRQEPKPFKPRMMQSSEYPSGRLEEQHVGITVPVEHLELHLYREQSRQFLYAYRHQGEAKELPTSQRL
ncbi:hypothetical protein Dxin01_00753 [Deinococcus xinjiangensis]|uniref:Uncharacterized protein n=1 Tax=Deinococcus xinjiangensis TaxID=457454 RepID=A0ABP9VBD4_9DEIO